MMDVDREPAPLPVLLSTKKKQLLTAAMKRTSEWIFSQEIPSDITVQVGGASFSLHKFPLVSKCGYIRKLVSEASDPELSLVELPDLPGGAEAFELAAKFCYGINFEINTDNVAELRCAAEQLEMTEDCAAGNLVSRTEDYLTDATLVSLPGAISVLRRAQGLVPLAERVNLVGRCVEAVACMACKEAAQTEADRGSELGGGGPRGAAAAVVEWWAEELTVLRVDVFKRVVAAMKATGFKEYALGPLLMLYAQKALRGLEVFGRGRRRMEAKKEHEKRVVLETVVWLLPRERHAMSVSFLAVLLRAATHLETTVACRLDLERRIALQLGHAVLDDLLIPSASPTHPSSSSSDTVFDLDTVQRILVNYLETSSGGGRDAAAEGGGSGRFGDDVGAAGGWASPPSEAAAPPGDMEQVGALMEGYLVEIASDANLSVSRFVNFAELIPEQARTTEDGMYRALDIYLKAHPSLNEMERKKVCGVMDCQKLSREACAHAAQNSRLPVQVVVQVLYYEQQRLRDHATAASSPGGSFSTPGDASPALSHRGATAAAAHHRPDYLGPPAVDELSRLRRENEDLKLELVRMRMQIMRERDAAAGATPHGSVASPRVGGAGASATPHGASIASPRGGGAVPMGSADKPPLPRKSIMSNVSKKLGMLNPFLRSDGAPRPPPPGRGRTKPPKDRRHSVS